jgi:CDP-diacylglycerol--serine O-phosphatidyltransferase
LDSLADVVTSGVVPGLMLFKLFQDIQEDDTSKYFLTEEFYYMGFVPYLGFIVTLASAYRLAKFNIDTRQTDSFIGLPTPANALLIMSIPMIQYAGTHEWLVDALYNPFVLLGIAILSAYMLNAEIPLFSLKMKDFSWEKNKLQVLFLVLSVVLLFVLGFTALPIIILLYVALSVINNTVLAKK